MSDMMSEQTSKPFAGLCHCGMPGLYVMHEGLQPSGRAIWFCHEHKPDFRQLQYEHAMSKRAKEGISSPQAPPLLHLNGNGQSQKSGRAQWLKTQTTVVKEGDA
jgi:hypothetical protein